MDNGETYCVLVSTPELPDRRHWELVVYSAPSQYIAPLVNFGRLYFTKEEAILAGTAKYGKVWRVNSLYCSVWNASWSMKTADTATALEIDAANKAWRDFVDNLEEVN